MNLTLAVSLLFLSGCHFCADEMLLLFSATPFLGIMTTKYHAWRHKKKCPHETNEVYSTITVTNSTINGSIIGGDKIE